MDNQIKNKLIRLYRHTPFYVKLYIRARLAIAEFEHLVSILPAKGTVFDVGCGYGVLGNIIHLSFPGIKVIGIDTNKKRVAIAETTVQKRKNIQFHVADASDLGMFGKADTVIFFDVLHHIPCNIQMDVLGSAIASLKQNGKIVIKEINTQPKWQYLVNLLHDTILNGGPLCYRSKAEWIKLLGKKGIVCKNNEYGTLYPHILIYGNKG